jgi:hypothetical protein
MHHARQADRARGRDEARATRGGVAGDLKGRFLREACLQAQLEHPAIVPVYDLARDPEGTLYFTMKRVRGATFEQIIDARADVYALGAILFGLLALEPLHPHASAEHANASTLRGVEARPSARTRRPPRVTPSGPSKAQASMRRGRGASRCARSVGRATPGQRTPAESLPVLPQERAKRRA